MSTIRSLGQSAGCISDGHSYEIDNRRVFVKNNNDKKVGAWPLTMYIH